MAGLDPAISGSAGMVGGTPHCPRFRRWPGQALPRAQICGMIEKVVSFQDIGVRARLQGRKINPLITLLLCPRGQNILEMCACGRVKPGHPTPAGGDRRGGCTTAGAWVAGTRPAMMVRASHDSESQS